MDTKQITVSMHSCIRVTGSKTIYFDPVGVKEVIHDADVICVTHDHTDHFDGVSIINLMKRGTVLVFPRNMEQLIRTGTFGEEELRFMDPGEELDLSGAVLTGIPAYNLDKPFHQKEKGWLGYLLQMDGICYYYAGDTDATEELTAVKTDVAFLPVGGTYTMTAEEAAEAALKMQPGLAIPVHYGSLVGRAEDGPRFAQLLEGKLPVELKIVIDEDD